MKCIVLIGKDRNYNNNVSDILCKMGYKLIEKEKYTEDIDASALKKYIRLTDDIIIHKPRGYGKYIINLEENEVETFTRAFCKNETIVFYIVDSTESTVKDKEATIIYKQDNLNVIIAYILKKVKEANHEAMR